VPEKQGVENKKIIPVYIGKTDSLKIKN